MSRTVEQDLRASQAPTADGGVRVVACPRPFSVQRVELVAPVGGTVADLVRACGVDPEIIHARVFVGDRFIPKPSWREVVPGAGDFLTIRVVPTGGGGGGKDPLRIVLQIAVIATAAFTGVGLASLPGLQGALGLAGAAALGVAGAAGVTVIGNLAVTALIPPVATASGSVTGAATDASHSYAITGSANRALPYGVIPRPYGRSKLFPPLGARPYTELVGNDQYYRMLFVVGYGPQQLSDLKIGETAIGDFGGDIQYEIRQGYSSDTPPTLFSNAVFEDTLTIALKASESWQVRSAQPNAHELSIDITCPQGLVRFDDGGNQFERTVQVEVQYRLVGAGSWTSAGTLAITDKRTSAVRRGLRWTVSPDGDYEVQVRRITPDTDDPLIRDQTYWTALRTIRRATPVKLSGMALVAMRVRATDRLSGVIDQFNLIAHSILKDWNGFAWVEQTTSNPAAIYRDIFQGAANARPLADSRLDLTMLQNWSANCAAAGREFNGIFDTAGTVFDKARAVASLGRAAFGLRDGKISVVQDVVQATPVQVFTPRNSWGFKGHKQFLDVPHGLKVLFRNPDADWQQDEIRVPDDGYGVTGADGVRRDFLGNPTGNPEATKFETLDLTIGCTRSDQAVKLARYHLAVGRLRPETYTFSADIENLVCTRGDLVRVVHDVPEFGLGSGRIKAVTTDGSGFATAITLDEPIAMEAGRQYAVRYRRADGTQVVQQVQTVEGEQATVVFTDPIMPGSIPAKGDLAIFGLLNQESVACIVKEITPGPEFTAQLTLVDYAPAVLSADQGTIPPYDSQITSPPINQQQRPLEPIVSGIRADEAVVVRQPNGALTTNFLVAVRFALGGRVAAEMIQVRVRQTGSTGQWTVFAAQMPGETGEVSVGPVVVGVNYDVGVRAVAASGMTSNWVTTVGVVANVTTPAPPNVTGLELFGQGNDTEFVGRDAKFQWRDRSRISGFGVDPLGGEPLGAGTGARDPFFKGYVVEIWNADGSALRRRELVQDALYAYSYEKNYEDAQRLSSTVVRAFTIKVWQMDVFNKLSVVPATLSVSNPAPAAPANFLATPLGDSIALTWAKSPDIDLDGYVLHRSTQSGFTPSPATQFYRGADNLVPDRSVVVGTTYYYRVAAVDTFGEEGLSYSGQASAMAEGIDGGAFDGTPPAVPVGLALTPALDTGADGTITGRITADWGANTEPDLAYYRLRIRQTAGGAQFLVVPAGTQTARFTGLLPNTEYLVAIQAVDKFNNASAFSLEVSATTPLNTTNPATPTGVTAVASFKGAGLQWNPNPELDILGYVVQRATDAAFTLNVETFGPLALTWFTDTGLDTDTTYYYRVKARNTSGRDSDYTTGVSATTSSVGSADIVASIALIQKLFATEALVNTLIAQANGLGTTTIEPGLVEVSGATTLADWRDGGDTTKIAGGQIATNTIAANKLTIGQRNIKLTDLSFTANKVTNEISWTAGAIAYMQDDGTVVTVTIGSGVRQWTTGTLYIYWVKGSTSLSFTTDVDTAFGVNHVVLASYQGGSKMVVDIGRTTIDGDYIATRTIEADKIKVNTLTGTEMRVDTAIITAVAQMANAVITNAHIQDGSIQNAKIQDATITTAKIGDAQITTAKIADAQITNAKIGTAEVQAVNIADANITSAKIQDQAVGTAKIADAQVTNAKVANATLQNAKLEDATIQEGKIANAAIATAKVQDAAIQTAKITDLNVTYLKIANNAATNRASANGTTSTPGNGTWADIATVTITTTAGQSVAVWGRAMVTFQNLLNTTRDCYLRLVRDSTQIEDTQNWSVNGGTVMQTFPFPGTAMLALDSPGAGTFTYKLQAYTTTGTGDTIINSSKIMVTEYVR